jgi:hypothetical protein
LWKRVPAGRSFVIVAPAESGKMRSESGAGAPVGDQFAGVDQRPSPPAFVQVDVAADAAADRKRARRSPAWTRSRIMVAF